jgi:hypothetical protein
MEIAGVESSLLQLMPGVMAYGADARSGLRDTLAWVKASLRRALARLPDGSARQRD